MSSFTAEPQIILFLASNPEGLKRVGQELRDIEEGLKRSQHRERFRLEQRMAVRPHDIQRALLDLKPQIVHFAGHGTEDEGLIFEDDLGNAKRVTGEAIAKLFSLFADSLSCVVLNGCYTEVQANAIAKYIPSVVGMKRSIEDKAAIAFAVGFYDALGAGRDVNFAFKLGCNAIDLDGTSEQDIPTLLTRRSRVSQRVFISYSSQEPDASLARSFHHHLAEAGHDAFMAADSIRWGDNWVQRIDDALRHCDYFLLLLSEQSASSDMVAGEVRLARQLRDELGKPIILPIRVKLPQDDPLNYELRSVLQTIQQRQWMSDSDTPVILSEILSLLSTGAPPEPIPEDIAPTAITQRSDRPPLPVAELELPGGTIELASKFYVQREPWESRCYEQIRKNAGLIRIKAPRQMGKTSLLARIGHQARSQGFSTATLDFLETDEAIFKDLTVFLKRFCALISRKVGVSPHKIKQMWDEELFGPKENCNDFFEQCILADLKTPLFLGLDELDRVFPFNTVAKEFFTLLRSWNEKAKVNQTWAKLRLAIAHSTESYVVMDTNNSPFNVGLAVELPEFNLEQVLDLAKRHGLSWGTVEIKQLMAMVGGHPYLVRLALYHIAQGDLTLSELLAQASTDAGIYGEHLRRHLWNLQQHPDLAAAFQQVVETEAPVRLPTMLAFKLNGMGLASLQGNDVFPRHEQLYRPYFKDRLRVRT